MENQQEAPDLLAVVTRNICNQLIAFQEAIATRAENPGVPTRQEIALQCKLINCLDKLRRLQGRTTKAKKENGENKAVTPGADMDSVNKSIPSHLAHSSHSTAFKEVSEQDFTDYKHILGTFGKLPETSKVRFRGRYVNARWLEYNLLQYCLPATSRQFIADAQTVLSTINHKDTQNKITEYLEAAVRVAA